MASPNPTPRFQYSISYQQNSTQGNIQGQILDLPPASILGACSLRPNEQLVKEHAGSALGRPHCLDCNCIYSAPKLDGLPRRSSDLASACCRRTAIRLRQARSVSAPLTFGPVGSHGPSSSSLSGSSSGANTSSTIRSLTKSMRSGRQRGELSLSINAARTPSRKSCPPVMRTQMRYS